MLGMIVHPGMDLHGNSFLEFWGNTTDVEELMTSHHDIMEPLTLYLTTAFRYVQHLSFEL